MEYPNYDSTADIEVINNNIKKVVQKSKEQDVEIKSKEPKFDKNSGWNLEKTDLVENDTNKVFSAKGAFDLKNYLITNYTTLMNNIRDTLTNLINGKLSHGGYNRTAQDLKNDVDNKVSKAGDVMTGDLTLPNLFAQQYLYIEDYYGSEGSAYFWFNKHRAGFKDNTLYLYGVDGLSIGSNSVYHTGFKPSPSDIGAVNKAGDTMTGMLNMDTLDNQFIGKNGIDNLDTLMSGAKGAWGYTANNPVSTLNIFPTTNNANGVLTLNTHEGGFNHQIGFSGNGKLYHRTNYSGAKSGWAGIYTENNIPTAGAVGAVKKTGDTMTGDLDMVSGSRFIGSHNYGFMNKRPDGNAVYSLLVGNDDRLHLGWSNAIPIVLDSTIIIDDVNRPINRTTTGIGYRIHSDGFKEAWGRTYLYNDETRRNITLPFTFDSDDWTVASSTDCVGTYDMYGNVAKGGRNNISYWNNWVGTRGEGYITWYVCGY